MGFEPKVSQAQSFELHPRQAIEALGLFHMLGNGAVPIALALLALAAKKEGIDAATVFGPQFERWRVANQPQLHLTNT